MARKYNFLVPCSWYTNSVVFRWQGKCGRCLIAWWAWIRMVSRAPENEWEKSWASRCIGTWGLTCNRPPVFLTIRITKFESLGREKGDLPVLLDTQGPCCCRYGNNILFERLWPHRDYNFASKHPSRITIKAWNLDAHATEHKACVSAVSRPSFRAEITPTYQEGTIEIA